MKMLDLVKARHSVRRYLTDPVEQSKLDYVMECVRLAPSAVNFQPWRFAVVTDSGRLAELKKAYPREWMADVPCIIVACADHRESWHRPADGKDHADIDVAIAVEHLCLAATEVGLGTCWVCNFDVALCRGALGLPFGVEPVVMVPVGYAADAAVPEKKRKSLEDIMIFERLSLCFP